MATLLRDLIQFFKGKGNSDAAGKPVDAVILDARVTGHRKETLEEVMLLLHVSPESGRHFIIQHTEFIHPHDIHQLLQIGQKVRVLNTSLHPHKVQLVV